MIHKCDLKLVSILNYKHWSHLSLLYDCNSPSVHQASARTLCTRKDETDLNSSGSNKEGKSKNMSPRLIISSKNRKCSRYEIIERYRLEKSVFGELCDTRAARKKKKLASKKESVLNKTPGPDIDAELHWILKTAPTNLKKISLRKVESDSDPDKDFVPTYSVQVIKTNTSLIHDQGSDETLNPSENRTNREESQKYDECPLLEDSVSDTNDSSVLSSDTTKTENVTPKPNGVSDDLIKNLQSFPIFIRKQSTESSESSEATASMAVPNADISSFPSVTKILRDTMTPESKQNLLLWEKDMIEKLGVDGFERHKRALLDDGKALHACIRDTLLRKTVTVPEHLRSPLECLNDVFQKIDDVTLIESNVFHPMLRYKGVVDCVVTYRGKRCVVDWKKSDKVKPTLKSTFDAPIQIAAYVGAINASNHYPFTIENGLVVVAHTNGEPAKVHPISSMVLRKYWMQWLEKLRQFYIPPHTTEK